MTYFNYFITFTTCSSIKIVPSLYFYNVAVVDIHYYFHYSILI